MSVTFLPNGYIRRTSGSFLSLGSDLTIMAWVGFQRYFADTTDAPVAPLKRMIYKSGPSLPFASFISLETPGDGTNKVQLNLNGAATIINPTAYAVRRWYHMAITFERASNTWTLYHQGSSVGTAVQDLSAITLGAECVADDGTGYVSQTRMMFFRSWQALLSPSQIVAEMASQVPVVTASLFTNTPLRTTSDINDTSGNGHTWSPSFIQSTHLNFAVAATPVSPTVVSSLDYSATLDLSSAATSKQVPTAGQIFGESSVYDEGWWKYTTNRSFIYLACPPSLTADPSYAPTVSVWEEVIPGVLVPYQLLDGSTDDQEFSDRVDGSISGGWFRVPLTIGNTYWFQSVQRGSPIATGALSTLEVQKPPNLVAPAGTFIIPDDSDGFPAAVVGADGTFYQYRPFPAGEFADVQPTGEACVQNGSADISVAFLDADYNIVATWTGTDSITEIKSDRNGKFYVTTVSNTGPFPTTLRIFTAAGILLSTHVLPTDFNGSGSVAAVSRDGSTWYQGQRSSGSVIHVYNLNTNTQLGDLTISTSGSWAAAGDGFTALDGSILMGKDFGGSHIERYSQTTGALLNSYPTTTITTINRFSFADDTPGSFYVWGYIGFGFDAYIERIQLDGTHVSTTPPLQVSGGSSTNTGLTDPNTISTSCPIFSPEVPLDPVPPDPAPPPTPPPVFIPPPTPRPIVPREPCEPDTQVTGGGIGNAGCNTGGIGRIPMVFTYGAANSHADPIVGESLLNNKGIDIWIQVDHTTYPGGSVVQYRRALTDLADVPTYYGGLKSTGLMTVGNLDHGFGNDSGTFTAAKATLVFSEAIKRWIRTILSTQDQLEGDTLTVYAATKAARDAGLPPRIMLRAVIDSPVMESGVKATVSSSDPLFAAFGPFGQFPSWPFWKIGDIFEDAPNDVKVRPAGPCYGSKSDYGATDPITHHPAEKGLVPWHWVGKYHVAGSVSGLPTTIDPGIGTVPSEAVLGMSDGGWVSDGTVTNDPYHRVCRVKAGVMGPLAGSRASTPAPVGTVYGFRDVWNDTTANADYWLSFQIPASVGLGWNPTMPVPAGADIRYQVIYPPASNPYPDWNFIAFWPKPTSGSPWAVGSIPDLEAWDMFFITHGAIKQGGKVYGSDLGGGDPKKDPDRVWLPMAQHSGSDILYPWGDDGNLDPHWLALMGPDPFHNVTGKEGKVYRCVLGFARGQVADDHKNGKVNITCNINAGIENKGDSTGDPIFSINDAFIHLLENFWIQTYRTGLWCDSTNYPKWPDGTPVVNTSSFAAYQEFTRKATIGVPGTTLGIGLEVAWLVDEFKSVMQWIADFNITTGGDVGYTGLGQIGLGWINDLAAIGTWPRISSEHFGFGNMTVTTGVNRVNYTDVSGDWDPDFTKFRLVITNLHNQPAIDRYHGFRKNDKPIESKMMQNEYQLRWVANRRLTLLGVGLTVIQFPGKIDLLDYDVTSPGLQLTSIEGLGDNGYIDRPVVVRRQSFAVANRVVTDTLWDVHDVTISTKFGPDTAPIVTDTSGSAPLSTDSLTTSSVIID